MTRRSKRIPTTSLVSIAAAFAMMAGPANAGMQETNPPRVIVDVTSHALPKANLNADIDRAALSRRMAESELNSREVDSLEWGQAPQDQGDDITPQFVIRF